MQWRSFRKIRNQNFTSFWRCRFNLLHSKKYRLDKIFFLDENIDSSRLKRNSMNRAPLSNVVLTVSVKRLIRTLNVATVSTLVVEHRCATSKRQHRVHQRVRISISERVRSSRLCPFSFQRG